MAAAPLDLTIAFQALRQLPEQLQAQAQIITDLRTELQGRDEALHALQQEYEQHRAMAETSQTTNRTLASELDMLKKEHSLAQQKIAATAHWDDVRVNAEMALAALIDARNSEPDLLRNELVQLRATLALTRERLREAEGRALKEEEAAAFTRADSPAHDDEDDGDEDDGRAEPQPPSQIPASWRTGLKKLPVPGIPPEAMKTKFRRDFLSHQIGGSTQGVVIRVAEDNTKMVLKQFKFERYYCPKTKGNPWLPATPGSHGFMFVGMRDLDETAGRGECCEVFIGFGENDWRYFGTYACTRVAPLTREDFNSLSADDKKSYCKYTTKKKLELAKSEDEAFRNYQEGKLRVPCVRIECQSFNHDLFQALRDNLHVVPASAPALKRQRSSSAAQRSPPSSKPTTPREPRSSVRLQAVPRPSYNEDEYDLLDDVAPPPKKRKSCESDAPPLVTEVTEVLIHPSNQSLHATG